MDFKNENLSFFLIDYAWKIIQDYASEYLKMYTKSSPGERKLSRLHSFTRSISKELYERSRSRGSLKDGATPLYVQDSEGVEEDGSTDNVFDEE